VLRSLNITLRIYVCWIWVLVGEKVYIDFGIRHSARDLTLVYCVTSSLCFKMVLLRGTGPTDILMVCQKTEGPMPPEILSIGLQ
jgi:hypothetical protein